MRRTCLVLLALALSGCGFEEPPAPAAGSAGPVATQAPSPVGDPCTDVALTLLDGQLNGLPSADPALLAKGGEVADQFQARYDQVIVSQGIAAAREQYAAQVQAACRG